MLVFNDFKIFAGAEFFFQQKFKRIFVVFINYKFFYRTVFQAQVQFVMPAAAMGAFALVGRTVCQIVGNQATPRIRHTHCPVHKAFKQNIRTCFPDFFHFFISDFSSQNAEFGSLVLPEFNGLARANVGLSGYKQV